MHLIEGDQVGFEVILSHSDVRVQWCINGEQLENSEFITISESGMKHTLDISSISRSQEGKLELIAGRAKTDCQILVQEVPVNFIKPLSDAQAAQGQDALFECEVSRESAEVKWFKHGRMQLRSGEKYDIKSEGCKRSLIVKNVSFEDEAKYSCVAGDSKSVAGLSCALTQVNIISGLNDEVTCSEGETVNFEVEISESDFSPVKWLQNGIELQPSQRVNISCSGNKQILELSDNTAVDSGDITFVVQSARSVCNFTVKAPAATFTVPLEDCSVAENKTNSVDLNVKSAGKTLKLHGNEMVKISFHQESSNSVLMVASDTCKLIQSFTTMPDNTQLILTKMKLLLC
jgi:hypothetical protein